MSKPRYKFQWTEAKILEIIDRKGHLEFHFYQEKDWQVRNLCLGMEKQGRVRVERLPGGRNKVTRLTS